MNAILSSARRSRSDSRAARKGSAKIYLVASSGGHLDLLAAVHQPLRDWPLVWVTQDSDQARAIQVRGDRVETLPFYGRSPRRLIKNVRGAITILARERPDVIITSGAGTVVPFCLLARLLGTRIVFIETMARVTNASITGNILSRFASNVIVQWPEMTRVYPHARLCQPALLVNSLRPATAPGRGTFVAVGTREEPFDRLLAMANRAIAQGVLPGPVVAQTGFSPGRVDGATSQAWMSPEEIQQAMSQARYVLCHAGSGVISTAVSVGRRPLVLPRLKAHGEHVDDHQVQIMERLGAMGLVAPIHDHQLSSGHLETADEPLLHDSEAFGAVPSIEEVLAEVLASARSAACLP